MNTFSKNNFDQIIAGIKVSATTLKQHIEMDPELKDEFECILAAAMSADGSEMALSMAGKSILADKHKVMQIMMQNGMNLQHAGAWRKDPEVVSVAVANNKQAIVFADINLLKEPRFMAPLMSRNFSQGDSLLKVLGSNAEVLKDAEMVKVMMNSLDPRSENDKETLVGYSKQIANNHSDNVEIMSRLVDVDFENVKYASDKLKTTTLKSANDKLEALEGLKSGEKRLKDLDKGCFADIEFFHKVKHAYDDRVKDIVKGGKKIDGLKEIVKLARMWAYMEKAKRTKEVSQQIERENDIRNKVEGYVNSLQNENEVEGDLSRA